MSAIDFTGKWKMDRAENVEEWLKVFDVNMVQRKAMSAARPTQEITQDGESFNVKMIGPMGKQMHEETFKLGEEFTTKLPFGVTIKGTPNWEGDKLVIKATSEDGKHTLSITREIVGDELKATSVADDVTCVRYFKK